LPLIAAVAFTAALIWQRRRPVVRAVLLAWAFVCIALIPVMGFTDVYFMKYSLVADHYAYIAVIGVAACVAAGLDRVLRPMRMAPHVLRATLLIVAGVATWQQAHACAGPEVLYRTTLQSNPGVSVLHNNLGAFLLDQSRNQEAATEFREALRLQPDLASAHSNLCEAAARLDLVDEALTECSTTCDQPEPGRRAQEHGHGAGGVRPIA
jgi:hypothetical protein